MFGVTCLAVWLVDVVAALNLLDYWSHSEESSTTTISMNNTKELLTFILKFFYLGREFFSMIITQVRLPSVITLYALCFWFFLLHLFNQP